MHDATEPESIPQLLRAFPRWCRWQLTPNAGGRPTKVPDQSTRELHRCRPWSKVEHVLRWEEEGVGFVTTGGLPVKLSDGRRAHLLLLDVDACVNSEGALSPWAVELLLLCGSSYAEYSPSKTGIRIAILVAGDKPPSVRATVRVAAEAPPGVDKAPAIQFFGFGAAGYVTITGNRLLQTAREPLLVDFVPIATRFRLLDEEDKADGKINTLKGHGPVTIEDIERKVRETKHGAALIAGEWKKVAPDRSASEAWSVLVRETLEAANGDGPLAVEFLQTRTAWGRGDIDDSADPDKYARRKWVERDVVRCARKGGGASVIGEFEALPDAPPAPPKPLAGDPGAVFDAWAFDGPLVHLPTGIPALDAMTGGGFVLGSRVYCNGAPNAGKTALAIQLADHYARMGITVGICGVDEEASDLAMRFLQRRGFSRLSCEQRDPLTIAAARAAFASLPVRLFDPTMSIEACAVALHRYACERNPGVDRPPCVLFIDSVQVARSEGESDDDTGYRAVTRRVAAIRAAASRYRMLVFATSEMSRAAYKAKRVEDQVTDMASGKESGAIEFSARVLLALRSVPLDADHVELRVAKNKHGPDHRPEEDGIFLRLDRARQTLAEDAGFQPLDVDSARENEKNERTVSDAAALVDLLGTTPASYRQAVTALAPAVTESRVRAAKLWLVECEAVLETPGPRGAKVMRLDESKLPESVLRELGRRMTEGG